MLDEEKDLPPQDPVPTPAPEPAEMPPYTPPTPAPTAVIAAVVDRIKAEIGKVIIGQDRYVDLMLASLLAGGHVLIEGVPGIAKTLTAKLLAQTLDVDFSRIQFTPDLMPSDVLGTSVFNAADAAFSFKSGPIFSNVVLIDEVNRAPAKTQAALFEVMEEFQVTVDGETYPMAAPFFVLATQNPIEQEGTYKLPEAQLDRFMVKIDLTYPDASEEKAILRRFRDDFRVRPDYDVQKVLSAEDVAKFRKLIEAVIIRDELLDYIADMVVQTRTHADLFLGASPRASLSILKMSKAMAALSGRNFVTPDDIQEVAYAVLNHRLILTPEREMEGFTTRDVIEEIVKQLEVPR